MPSFRIAFLGIDHPHGAGWRETLLNLGEDVSLTAYVPRLGNTCYSLEERHVDTPRFESVEALLASGSHLFDGAIVCLPNNEAPAAVTQLAQAGKHVLLEKPGAATAAEARAMVAAVQKAGIAFQSGYLWRYDDGANRLQAMHAGGRFGRLIGIEMTWVTSNVARRGADHYLFDPQVTQRGFFSWLACHWIDLLHYVTGDVPVAVTARVGTFGETPIQVDDGGTAILEMSRGTLVTFVGGYWLPRWAGEGHWNLRGSQRWVHWDPNRAGTGGVITIHGPQPQFQPMDEVFTLPVDTTPGYGGARSLALVSDWIEAARTGGRPCRNTPESLLATLDVLDAIYQSSNEERRVELSKRTSRSATKRS